DALPSGRCRGGAVQAEVDPAAVWEVPVLGTDPDLHELDVGTREGAGHVLEADHRPVDPTGQVARAAALPHEVLCGSRRGAVALPHLVPGVVERDVDVPLLRGVGVRPAARAAPAGSAVELLRGVDEVWSDLL